MLRLTFSQVMMGGGSQVFGTRISGSLIVYVGMMVFLLFILSLSTIT